MIVRRRPVIALLVAAVALAALPALGCGSEGSGARPAAPSAGAAGAGAPGDGRPSPNARIPRRPASLARALTANTRALLTAIDAWRRDGARGKPPREVMLRALYHQRVHTLLGSHPGLARRVLARLPRGLASEARDLIAARHALAKLAGPTPPLRHWRTGRALPPRVLMSFYGRAERRFGVSRRVLAAVNLVETDFNRLRNRSTSGARGPMQFMPSTWRAHGLGGDIDDPHDAIMGAAKFLRDSGAPGAYPGALYAYNPSRLYAGAVLRYARRMRRDFREYYVLYGWQVFVRTRSGGLRRLTGP